jgi:hypothetical protein
MPYIRLAVSVLLFTGLSPASTFLFTTASSGVNYSVNNPNGSRQRQFQHVGDSTNSLPGRARCDMGRNHQCRNLRGHRIHHRRFDRRP